MIPPLLKDGGPLDSIPLPSKQQLIESLAAYINSSLRDWFNLTLIDLSTLCTNNHRQYLELKVKKCLGWSDEYSGALLVKTFLKLN